MVGSAQRKTERLRKRRIRLANMTDKKVIIIGAGPAGLTAAYELLKAGVSSIILEADETVGGLARTVNYKDYLFDIGGHRFFTKWDEVQKIWQEVLGDSFRERRRFSRIYYKNRFFFYPLRPANALAGLGIWESVRILLSYLQAQLSPQSREDNFEQWVTKRFGKRLYEIFFKTYTEKVWGIPCTEIRAEWAAQRIKSLSLGAAVRQAIFRKKTTSIKSLIERFHYPDYGPGQMWERLAQKLHDDGSPVILRSPVARIKHSGRRVTEVLARSGETTQSYSGTDFISSMPVRELINALDPPPPEEVKRAANSLRYRDFMIVSLILRRRDVMSDNWIYIHDPNVHVGRIQNFKNWSPSMVPDQSKTCLGMEYFVGENDELWRRTDEELIEMAKRELAYLKLAVPEEIEDGKVVRVLKAYPVYDSRWAEHILTIRTYLHDSLRNLQLVGRNGMHKYNNQDHSMMTAIYAARNILGENNDLWAVNTEPEYHEQTVQRLPSGIQPKTAFQKLNAESSLDS
jgi:protoporphyrinogen oxidase